MMQRHKVVNKYNKEANKNGSEVRRFYQLYFVCVFLRVRERGAVSGGGGVT